MYEYVSIVVVCDDYHMDTCYQRRLCCTCHGVETVECLLT